MSAPRAPFDNRQYWESRLRGHFSLAGVGYLRLGRRYNAWMYRVRGEVFDRVVRESGIGKQPGIGNRESGIRKQPGIGNRESGIVGTDSRFPNPDSRIDVLDVGAGTGFYVDRWQRLGARVTGLDLTEVAVAELARRFPGCRFIRADIGGPREALPLAPDAFDAVSAFDVLFHLVDDAQYARAFENIAALLRPGGWFLWSDNFLRHAAERVAHQVSRPLAESARRVEAAGFEIVRRVPMFVLMNYPADTRSRLARWAWTAMVAPAMVAEPVGWLLGAALYPVEQALVRVLRESPSTELMVCRKRR